DSLAPCLRTVEDDGAAATLSWSVEWSEHHTIRGAAFAFLPSFENNDRSQKARQNQLFVQGGNWPKGHPGYKYSNGHVAENGSHCRANTNIFVFARSRASIENEITSLSRPIRRKERCLVALGKS